MMRILLTNIQRFSLHDGPGIRTTVFLKGCSLRCPWCANPENLSPRPQEYVKDGVKGIYGIYYTPEALARECLKDRVFYGEGTVDWHIGHANQIEQLPGGVTFSGGEALLQMEALTSVCEALHAENVHIAVETCLFVPRRLLELAMNHIDFFYVDVKLLSPERCRAVEGGDISIYLDNLEELMAGNCPVVIRIPVIGEHTAEAENRRAVHDLLSRYRRRILKIELIKEHNLGEAKYKSLGMEMVYHDVSDAQMEQYKKELEKLGIIVQVCKI